MMKRLILLIILLMPGCQDMEESPSCLITNVVVIDGTGQQPVNQSVRIQGDRIIDVGDLSPRRWDTIVDGKGLALVPGFIDTHSHHDSGRAPTFEAAVTQGITTVVIGQDGFSHFPLKAYLDTLDSYPAPVNIASYAGHNTLRLEVMGIDNYSREASENEIDSMKVLLKEELESGALGMSTGLEYDPGIYSNTEEVVALAKVLAPCQGRYMSHLRSEDVGLEKAIGEIIHIGKEAEIPVQISHFKLARKSLWGQVKKILDILDQARDEGVEITADVYPYEYWASTMTVLFPRRDFDNIESARFALTELTSPEDMIISKFIADTSYEGKTLAVIAGERDQDPAQTYLDLIRMSRDIPGEGIIARSMTMQDILTLLAWPHTNVCSDGSPTGHPRGWGAFPRYFYLANDVSISERIARMTSLSAAHLGLKEIGVIRPGAFADLVLLDPHLMKDRATFESPDTPSEGIVKVWVSGKIVFENAKMTGSRPGRVIRKPQ